MSLVKDCILVIALMKPLAHQVLTVASPEGMPLAKASEYIQTLLEMFLDGALHLEDVRSLEADTAYQELTEKHSYPTSDAMGDWLRRHGGRDGEYRLWSVIAQLLTLNMAKPFPWNRNWFNVRY